MSNYGNVNKRYIGIQFYAHWLAKIRYTENWTS